MGFFSDIGSSIFGGTKTRRNPYRKMGEHMPEWMDQYLLDVKEQMKGVKASQKEMRAAERDTVRDTWDKRISTLREMRARRQADPSQARLIRDAGFESMRTGYLSQLDSWRDRRDRQLAAIDEQKQLGLDVWGQRESTFGQEWDAKEAALEAARADIADRPSALGAVEAAGRADLEQGIKRLEARAIGRGLGMTTAPIAQSVRRTASFEGQMAEAKTNEEAARQRELEAVSRQLETTRSQRTEARSALDLGRTQLVSDFAARRAALKTDLYGEQGRMRADYLTRKGQFKAQAAGSVGQEDLAKRRAIDAMTTQMRDASTARGAALGQLDIASKAYQWDPNAFINFERRRARVMPWQSMTQGIEYDKPGILGGAGGQLLGAAGGAAISALI